MRIGLVTEWFERGAAYVSRQYAEIFEDAGHEIFIFCRSENLSVGEKAWPHPRLHQSSALLPGFPKFIAKKEIQSWVKDNEIEMVIFNEQIWIMPAVWIREIGVKIGCYVDYYTKKTISDFVVYDFLICHTIRHLSVFSWHSQVFNIPWAVDTQIYTPETGKSKTEGLTFFHSAGWSPERKGTDLVIEAFGQIPNNRCRLIIHSQANILDKFSRKAETLRTLLKDSRIKIIHESVPAPGLYALGDVYVYPTRLEGIGLSYFEALSSGLPIIVTNVPPMNEISGGRHSKFIKVKSQQPRQDGYFWPMSEPSIEHLVTIMKSFLRFNPSEIQQMKQETRIWSEMNIDRNGNFTQLLLNVTSSIQLRKKQSEIRKIKIKRFGYPFLYRGASLIFRYQMKIRRIIEDTVVKNRC